MPVKFDAQHSELSQDEAELVGAFVEDALSEADALESIERERQAEAEEKGADDGR